jgi:hypothetical protein
MRRSLLAALGAAFVALGVAFVALGCGADDPAPSGAPLVREAEEPSEERLENGAPQVDRLVLQPEAPLPGQRIEARVEASDPDGDPIRVELEWRQGGRVIAKGPRTTLEPEGLVKGEELMVIATASDGRDTSDPVRESVTVGNTAPLISAFYLTPDGEIGPGQEVGTAPQALDADGDELEYEFEWLLNGEVVRNANGPTFATDDLRRGDRLQARVRVSDGEAWSPVAESMTLTLANRPPRILEPPALERVAGGVRGTLEAEDPDGDRTLRFRVVAGPPGLGVDSVTGVMSFKPPPGTVGTQAVEIAVADAYGAESALRFELTVSNAETEARPAPPASDAESDELDADDEDGDADDADEEDETANEDSDEDEDE